MAVAQVDSALVILTYLETAGPLHNEVSSFTIPDLAPNIYAIEGANDYSPRTTGGIIFYPVGGGTNKDIPVKVETWQFNCFGGSLDIEKSWQLARALNDRLHGIQLVAVGSNMIMLAHEVLSAQALPVGEGEAAGVFVRYECHIRTN